MSKPVKLPIEERKEIRLLSKPLLRFKKDYKPNDLVDIIYNLMKQNGSYYEGTKLKTYTSTTNRESGNFSTRSIEDTFRVCRYYIPDIKYKQVFDAMKLLKSKNILHNHYCPTCQRSVFRMERYNETKETITNNLKELNIKIN